ncbi:helix-turn-helix domain-containing protein [Butyrivibrio sp. INlla14]|uniref:helix-turn-helix domain-containing protein n=1 Tax=Butyrivibrio sp. INlla14 TaxID=1520808 RepID=UPI000876751F|nr:AraC family transcriptional regulator [Butyrivibrio sp. INlla14]SCY28301.1 AraC-type DNA-binding protein [Butyrivibrio sp. INlla14]
MKKALDCPYSMIDQEIICEHKTARVTPSDIKTVHNHDGYEIVLFLKGDVNIMIEPDIYQMKRGDMFLVSPLVFHGLDLEDISGYERIVINVQYETLKRLGDEDTDFSTIFRSSDSPNMNHVHIPNDKLQGFIEIADRLEAALNSDEFGHTILSRALLVEFLIMTNKFSTSSTHQKKKSLMPSVVSRIFDYIDSHIEENITIKDMSEALHYSSDHLSRVFSEATGDSLKHYISGKKIVLAQKLLLQNYPPYDVCFMAGYNNYSSFSRRFSQQIGMSPKQYQLANKEPSVMPDKIGAKLWA